MVQHIDIEEYKRLVDRVGIEEAYKQRFRCTGRTVRDVLTLAIKLSEGKHIILYHRSWPGQTLDRHREVLDSVQRTIDSLGMHFERTCRDVLKAPQSGGSLRVVSPSACIRGWRVDEEYKLHDC